MTSQQDRDTAINIGVIALIVLALLAAVVLAHNSLNKSPRHHGYRLIGTVSGEHFWAKLLGNDQISLTTTGSAGNVCSGSGPASPHTQAICDDGTGDASVFAQVVAAGEHPLIRTAGGNIPARLLPFGRISLAVAVRFDNSLIGASLHP